jgi:excisionase family DNA binding protein
MDRAFTDIQASKVLGLRPQTLRNWRIARKGPPYHKFGRAVRYRLEDLEDWLKSKKICPESECGKTDL